VYCFYSYILHHSAQVAPDGLTRSEACANTLHFVPNIPSFYDFLI